jgi:hypothetical protein
MMPIQNALPEVPRSRSQKPVPVIARTKVDSTQEDLQREKNDLLKPQLHIAYAHRGQAYEAENNAFEAISSYRRAIEVVPKGIAHDLLDSCLPSYRIPSVDFEDAGLKPYSDLMTSIATADNLTEAFGRIVTHINAKTPDHATIEGVNKARIPQLFLARFNFQLSSDLGVDVGLTLGNYFMRRGGDSV